MKLVKKIITCSAVVSALILPSSASAACNVGISNNLDVVPPAALFQGATENHNYSVSSCTIPDRITVEWVMVKNSTQSWIDNPANRTPMIPETSMGRQMQGATSWTAPANAQPGHYAVITRYYAQGQNYAEATAASSFTVKPDVCPNIAGGQDNPPAGYFINGAGNCVRDICPNLTGNQENVPAGYFVNASGSCVQDVCPNIGGNQETVPAGYFTNSAGSCVPDVCPNITGNQENVPAGYFVNGAGSCVQDVCPNLAGGQESVPSGLIVDSNGSCVSPPPPPPVVTTPPPVVPPTTTVVPPTPPVIVPPVDVCPNLAGNQETVPANLTVTSGGDCTLVLPPTGNPPKPLVPKPVITKVANRTSVTTGQNIIYTMTLRNAGKGAMLNVKMCDKLPAGTTYVGHTGKGYFSNGNICWNMPRLAAGAKMTVKMTLKAAKTYKGRTLVNTVCATSSNAPKVCARATVKVIRAYVPQPAGGVTG